MKGAFTFSTKFWVASTKIAKVLWFNMFYTVLFIKCLCFSSGIFIDDDSWLGCILISLCAVSSIWLAEISAKDWRACFQFFEPSIKVEEINSTRPVTTDQETLSYLTNHLIHHSEAIWLHTSETKFHWNHCLVSSVGRALVCWAEGSGFKPQLDQHSGSLNNWEESAAFLTIDISKWLDFLIFSDKDKNP